MEVGACTAACTAHIADDLSLFNLGPSSYPSGKSPKMGVVSPEYRTVLNLNELTIATPFPTSIGDPAVCHGSDRRSRPCGEVYSAVRPLDLENRVNADMGECGADTAKLNGVAEKSAGKGSPFEVIVVTRSVLFFKVKGEVFLSSVDQGRGQYAKGFVFIASLPIPSLVEDFKGISRSYVGVKIYIPGKDVHELGDNCEMDPQTNSTLIKRIRYGSSNGLNFSLIGSLSPPKDNPLILSLPG